MRQGRSGGGPGLLLGTAALVLLAVSPAAGAPQVALVVGNTAYEHVAPLVNPAHDAADVAARLKALGFDVELARDLDAKQLSRAVRKLAGRAQDAEAAVFFYAGHGVQKDRVPYLVPTDAEIAAQGDVALETVRLADLLAPLETDNRATIVLLDACRNDPFAGAAAAGDGAAATAGRALVAASGLGQPAGGRGTLIGYATGDGDTAADGRARNSPFTASLLKHIETPGLDVRELLRRVRADLASGGSRQLSETSDRLSGQFYFRPPEPKAEAPGRPAPQQPSLADLPDYVVWKGIETACSRPTTSSSSRPIRRAAPRPRRGSPAAPHAGLGMSVEVVPAKPSATPAA
jgi:uncharacterized caspase-like protein